MSDARCPVCNEVAMKNINKIFTLGMLKCKSCGHKLRLQQKNSLILIAICLACGFVIKSLFGTSLMVGYAASMLLIFLPASYFNPLEPR